jgi:hypothetical protein
MAQGKAVSDVLSHISLFRTTFGLLQSKTKQPPRVSARRLFVITVLGER